MIEISKLSFKYPIGHKNILCDVSLSIAKGDFVVLLGASGSGKTTLLKLISGLEQQTNGMIRVDGKISMVFQSGALLPWRTVEDNVSLPLEAAHEKKEAVTHRVRSELARVGLAEFHDKYPRELSGGQRQRVGLARALAVAPDILLLDEPFSALDIITAEKLRQDLLHIWKELGITVVMVSHSVEEAVELAQTICVLKDGHLHEPIHHPTQETIAHVKHLL